MNLVGLPVSIQQLGLALSFLFLTCTYAIYTSFDLSARIALIHPRKSKKLGKRSTLFGKPLTAYHQLHQPSLLTLVRTLPRGRVLAPCACMQLMGLSQGKN